MRLVSLPAGSDIKLMDGLVQEGLLLGFTSTKAVETKLSLRQAEFTPH
jgi:hypothetical protein